MDLHLNGKTLLSETIEYSAVLHFSDDYMARIESPFSLNIDGRHYEFSPETDPHDTFQPLEALLQQTVTTADVDNSGVLSLAFSNGATIRVDHDDDYEAWTIAGPDGFLIVSMPGGELAVWGPKTDSP